MNDVLIAAIYKHALVVITAIYIGYVLGFWRRSTDASRRTQLADRAEKAGPVLRQLRGIADGVRRDLATHRASLTRLRDQLLHAASDCEDQQWRSLCQEAADTIQLASHFHGQVEPSLEQALHQAQQLLNPVGQNDGSPYRTEGRQMSDWLRIFFALFDRYERPFSVAMINLKPVEHDANGEPDDATEAAERFHQKLRKLVRTTDFVTCQGELDFAVLMPETRLKGAAASAERVRRAITDEPVEISVGVASALDGDNDRTLINRADAALYSAKSSGGNCVYQHTGLQIDRVTQDTQVSEAIAT
ncbi:MAG: GGDEF domain-containing protein [Planctomycetales bacterium]|nr:GGDEF domain-containing protein [Planctomycetales bacterium]